LVSDRQVKDSHCLMEGLKIAGEPLSAVPIGWYHGGQSEFFTSFKADPARKV